MSLARRLTWTQSNLRTRDSTCQLLQYRSLDVSSNGESRPFFLTSSQPGKCAAENRDLSQTVSEPPRQSTAPVPVSHVKSSVVIRNKSKVNRLLAYVRPTFSRRRSTVKTDLPKVDSSSDLNRHVQLESGGGIVRINGTHGADVTTFTSRSEETIEYVPNVAKVPQGRLKESKNDNGFQTTKIGGRCCCSENLLAVSIPDTSWRCECITVKFPAVVFSLRTQL